MRAVLLVLISATISSPQNLNMPLLNLEQILRDKYFKYSGQYLGNTVYGLWNYARIPRLRQLIPGVQDFKTRLIFVRGGSNSFSYVKPVYAQNNLYRTNWTPNMLPDHTISIRTENVFLNHPIAHWPRLYSTESTKQAEHNFGHDSWSMNLPSKKSDGHDDLAQVNRRKLFEDSEDTKCGHKFRLLPRYIQNKFNDCPNLHLKNKDEAPDIPLHGGIKLEMTRMDVETKPKRRFHITQTLTNLIDEFEGDNTFRDVQNHHGDQTSRKTSACNTMKHFKDNEEKKKKVNSALERSSTQNYPEHRITNIEPSKRVLGTKMELNISTQQGIILHGNDNLNVSNKLMNNEQNRREIETDGFSDLRNNAKKIEEVDESRKKNYNKITSSPFNESSEIPMLTELPKIKTIHTLDNATNIKLHEDTEFSDSASERIVVNRSTFPTQGFGNIVESSRVLTHEWVTAEMENTKINESIIPARHNIKFTLNTQNEQVRQVTYDNTRHTKIFRNNYIVAKGETNVTSYQNEHTDQVSTKVLSSNESIFKDFKAAVAKMEKHFYSTSFRLLSENSPEDRRQNGISFVLSTVWLHMLLLLLSSEIDANSLLQLNKITHFPRTLRENDIAIKAMMASLPPPSESLKLTWSSRLVLGAGMDVSDKFRVRANETLGLIVDRVNTDNVTLLVDTLNDMVLRDTGGTMRGTFDESDVGGGVEALLLNTVYLRSRWRAPVTLLNGSRDFRDAPSGPYRQTRMFRVNDVVGYADLPEWDAEAVEIPYATANLSLLAVVPRSGMGLRAVAARAADAGAGGLLSRLKPRRVAVSLPLFTLRMTLLLPNKLQAMGASALVSHKEADENTGGLRLSHALQRLMFWAEAGRNAYKDDGIEWDPKPEMSLVVDRPYFFMVKHMDVVLMTGNFAL